MNEKQTILVETIGRVATIHLNRQHVRNALNAQLMNELLEVATTLDRDPMIGCLLLTGGELFFSAGADIRELATKSYMEMFHESFFEGWDRFAALRTPKIAVVNGYALGGGCELAMMCDLIFASETAVFGQPEIKLGVIPGMGGSQRLTKAVGKAKAMDMILTGRTMDAYEAERAGLVARVLPVADVWSAALEAAQSIANYSKTATIFAREAVNRALEVGLNEGMVFERRTYYAMWETAGKREGMNAFLEKRQPNFCNL